MPLQDTDQYLIDSHLLGRLSAKEQQQFQERMKNAAFASSVQFQKDAQQAMQTIGREEAKRKVQDWEQDLPQAKIRLLGRRSVVQYLAAASVLFAFAWIAYWLFASVQQTQTDRLFATYYEPLPNLVAPIEKSNSEQLDAYKKPFQLYELKEYAAAIRAFDRLGQQNNETHLYKGLSHLALEQYDAAIASLENVKDSSDYAQVRNWYLGLAHLKQQEVVIAKQYLQRVQAKGTAALRKKASQLLQQLE